MKDFAYIPLSGSPRLKSYIFKVVCEKDTWPGKPNTRAIWRASVPALSGAHAWGNTEQEAFENLKDAVDAIIEDLKESGQSIPTEPSQQVHVSREPLLTVTM